MIAPNASGMEPPVTTVYNTAPNAAAATVPTADSTVNSYYQGRSSKC